MDSGPDSRSIPGHYPHEESLEGYSQLKINSQQERNVLFRVEAVNTTTTLTFEAVQQHLPFLLKMSSETLKERRLFDPGRYQDFYSMPSRSLHRGGT